MATRAYIGTARSVTLNSRHTEIKEESEEERTEQLRCQKPIKRDPILVYKYTETMSRFPKQRGKVDHTKVVARLNKQTGERKQSTMPSQGVSLMDSSFRPRSDTLLDEDVEVKETLSQATYLLTCQRMNIHHTASIYKGLAKGSLSVKYHPIRSEALKAACVALVCNTVVATLDLTGLNTGITGGAYVADVLRENLYILDLTIAENNIGSEGIQTICDAMRDNQTLKYLNVSGNRLIETDAIYIRDMLMENTTLKGLNISHNEFRDAGGQLLAEGIEGNDSLEDIDFSWNHLRQRGARKILTALLENATVRRADLSYNGFHDAAELLGRVLAENTTIVYLDLGSNRLTDVDMAGIVKGFAHNETLETLLIGNNPFTAPICYQLLDIVNKTPANKIKELDLESQTVELEFLDLIQNTRESRQLYINHGTVLKSTLSRKEISDDFSNSDPIMVLMECIAQKNLKLIDLFQKIDKDSSQSISRTELKEGLRSLNIPMSGKAIDTLMRRLDVDDNGEIDFAELMEGHREYMLKKEAQEERAEAGLKKEAETAENVKLKDKVTKLMKKRRLAKMALVLDTSTEQMKRVIKMNKELPLRQVRGEFVDDDARMMERIAKSALSLSPKKLSGVSLASRHSSGSSK